MSSIPTEMRTMPSVIPIAFRPFSPSAACVMVAGCEISVSTPPNDSAREQTRNFLQHPIGILQRSGFEGDHRSEAAHLPFSQRMLRMIGKPGIENSSDLLVFREKIGDDAAVAVMDFHARGQSLHSAQHQPAFKWRKNRARAFLQESEFLGLLRLAANHYASQTIAMAVEKLRGGMDHHVRTQRQWLLKIRRHEGVVDYELNFLAAADLADRTAGRSTASADWSASRHRPCACSCGSRDPHFPRPMCPRKKTRVQNPVST